MYHPSGEGLNTDHRDVTERIAGGQQHHQQQQVCSGSVRDLGVALRGDGKTFFAWPRT